MRDGRGPAPREVRERPPAGSYQAPPAKRRKRRVSVLGLVVVAGFLALPVAVTVVPVARILVYIAWMVPLIELGFLLAGQLHYRRSYREAPRKFKLLVIQITTTGREYDRVSEILSQLRGFELRMPHQLWVVIEPGTRPDYPDADRVIVVPRDFTCRAQRKARALEYSRLVRRAVGLDRPDVKILFVDDDVSLTRPYIVRAFRADYDLCQGVIAPRTAYGTRPLSHFLTSHADDIRTHSCLVYCSMFQGFLGRPLHVHGEGLAVTGRAESLITWDLPVVASEDLAFGQRARRLGLSWGWFREFAEITSPWSVRDYMVQRSRWLWGDVHAIRHRSVMPLSAAILTAGKYALGMGALSCSAAGLWLRINGSIHSWSPVLDWAKLSVLAWAGLFFACGWIGAGSAHEHRGHDSRMLSGVLAVLMMPVSALLTLAAVLIPLLQGDPGDFKVIRKTR